MKAYDYKEKLSCVVVNVALKRSIVLFNTDFNEKHDYIYLNVNIIIHIKIHVILQLSPKLFYFPKYL